MQERFLFLSALKVALPFARRIRHLKAAQNVHYQSKKHTNKLLLTDSSTVELRFPFLRTNCNNPQTSLSSEPTFLRGAGAPKLASKYIFSSSPLQ